MMELKTNKERKASVEFEQRSRLAPKLKTNKERKALQGAICTIAEELDIDVDKTRECIKNYTKEKLLEIFTEMKDLRLRQENLRLILLIKVEEE